jgi:hypothetical protein
MGSADVLSTVQNSMSAGQDPSQALSRLMDWAEARGVSDLIEYPLDLLLGVQCHTSGYVLTPDCDDCLGGRR